MARLDGKVVFITGGESGIGAQTARVCAAEGARVHVTGLDASALEAVANEVGGSWSVADVRDSGAVQAAVAACTDRYGRLDVVLSNAGNFGTGAPITSYPLATFKDVLDVHVVGAFNVLQHTLEVISDGGSVIITSSVVGLTADPGIAGYATAKHAQVGLMRVAAKEMAARGVRVNTIHPGPVSTPFQDNVEHLATGGTKEEGEAFFNAMIPLGRHGTTDEIARTIAFLASDDAAFITGATIAVDGGMSI